MALIKFAKVGTTKTATSVMTNDSYYTHTGKSVTLKTVRDSTTLFTFTGINLSSIAKNMQVNGTYTLFRFKDGGYFWCRCTAKDSRTWGGNLFTYYFANVQFYYTNSAGTSSTSLSEALIYEAIRNGVTYPCPIYVCAGVDDSSKLGYVKFVYNNPIAGEGTVTTFGTEIKAVDGYGITAATWYNILTGNGTEFDPDPWSNAGYAGIGGGDGVFDFTPDTVGLPTVPSVDSVSTGFLQLFCGSLDKIVELSRYMWSTDFFDNIVKLTSNPIDIIMGLYMYPFVIPTTAQKKVRAGNVVTNISMGVPDSQIFEVDCGTFPVPQFYGAYLDFEPFSKCEIYLPYCGTFNLSMDDISGKDIRVKYRVDLLTGLCVAYVIIDGTVRYNFTGSCAVNIPISSRSFENLYNSIMGLVGSMFGGGNFSAPSIGSVAGAVSSGKNQITHGGIASGNAGYLGVQKPYLIFNIPRVAIPKGLNTYTGYPIFATYKLGDLKGYTEVEEIHLENMGTATKDEIDRVVSLLKGGVIL